MSYIDVAIPGIVGLLLALWPGMAFTGSTIPLEQRVAKLRTIRLIGFLLLAVAAVYLIVRLAAGH